MKREEAIQFRILRNSSVKLTVSDVGEGSAFLLKPSKDSSFFYVLTAKHCLIGKKFEKKLSGVTIQLDFPFPLNTNTTATRYQLKETDRIILSNNEEEDLAIIVLSRGTINLPQLWTDSFPVIPIINPVVLKPETKFFIRGFPQSASGKKAKNLHSNKLIDNGHGTPLFEVAIEGYDNNNYDAVEILEGFSGSGILIKCANQMVLTGVVVECDGNLRRLICNNLLEINSLLQKEKDIRYEFMTILPDEDMINLILEEDFQQVIRILSRNPLRPQNCDAAIKLLRSIKQNSYKLSKNHYFNQNLLYKRNHIINKLIEQIRLFRSKCFEKTPESEREREQIKALMKSLEKIIPS